MTNSFRKDPQSEILPLLSGNYDTLEIFFKSGQKTILKKGNIIVNQGDMVQKIYLLNKGKIKVTLLADSGIEKLFWYAFPHTIFGDVPFFCRLPSNATITAEEECEILSHSYQSFFEGLNNNPDVVEFLLITMAKKIQILTGQVKDISFNKPNIRINKLLYSLSKQFGKECGSGTEINLLITHREIGFLTGLHRVTVTNILNKLKKEKIISIPKRGKIIITDMEGLYTKAFHLDLSR